ncbi:MAG TPA: hypothetical protein VGV09_20590, partial [Steroidobacteraceae bacterium]|nr:hypothetical protein [Steroidobacteraceae bacterium]
MGKTPLLGDSAVVNSSAVRTLFIATAMVTIAILLWTQHLKLAGYVPSFTPIYYELLVNGDSTGAMVLLVVLMCAALLPARPSYRCALRWVGAHPGIVAAVSAIILMCGTLFVYHDHRLSKDEYTEYFQSQIF